MFNLGTPCCFTFISSVPNVSLTTVYMMVVNVSIFRLIVPCEWCLLFTICCFFKSFPCIVIIHSWPFYFMSIQYISRDVDFFCRACSVDILSTVVFFLPVNLLRLTRENLATGLPFVRIPFWFDEFWDLLCSYIVFRSYYILVVQNFRSISYYKYMYVVYSRTPSEIIESLGRLLKFDKGMFGDSVKH